MKEILLVAIICMAVCQNHALQCYQCDPVTQECSSEKAEEIKCGSNGKCVRQFKIGADGSLAIRKCVIPDTAGKIPCPKDFTCTQCDKDLCNSGSLAKFTWITLISFFTVLVVL